MKFSIGKGNRDLVGNNTPVFFLRDPHRFPDLNRAVNRVLLTTMGPGQVFLQDPTEQEVLLH